MANKALPFTREWIRLVWLILACIICLSVFFYLLKTEKASSSSLGKKIPVPKTKPITILPFQEDPMILNRVRDDEYLEKQGFYYLLHKVMAMKQEEWEKSIDHSLGWNRLLDPDRTEIRGKVAHISAVIGSIQPFPLGKSGECYLFYEDEIRDIESLAKKFRDMDIPFSRHIQQFFSEDTHALLASYDGFKKMSPQLKMAILNELNKLLYQPLLYEKGIQDGLSERTQKLFAENNLKALSLMRANRFLLEDIYPEIVKTEEPGDRGMENAIVWLCYAYTETNQHYFFITPEIPKDIREYDKIEFTGAFFKIWVYQNKEGVEARAPVFVGKNLRVLSRMSPPKSNIPLYIVCFLGIVALLFFSAIIYEKKRRRHFLKPKSSFKSIEPEKK